MELPAKSVKKENALPNELLNISALHFFIIPTIILINGVEFIKLKLIGRNHGAQKS